MLDRLKSFPDAGVLGCTLLNGDLTIQTSCIQSFPTLINQVLDCEFLRRRWPTLNLWGMRPLFEPSAECVPVEVVSGACMMLRRDRFEEVGRFTEAYFMYAEDVDLCYKLACAGYQNYYTPDARIVHYGGRSSSANIANVMQWNARILYAFHNHGWLYGTAFRIAMGMAALVRISIVYGGLLVRPAHTDRRVIAKWRTILQLIIRFDRTTTRPVPPACPASREEAAAVEHPAASAGH